jgi:hypothetical protein
MAANLDAILRVTAKVFGEAQVYGLAGSLQKVEQAGKDVKNTFAGVVSSSVWQGMAAAAAATGAAIGAAFVVSTRSAIAFEDSVAQVAKVMEGLDKPGALTEIKREMIELSKVMPIAAQGFADIYAAAGQAGIPRAEVKAFAEDVAKVSIAFDMTAAEAGTALAKIRSGLGMSQPQVRQLADAINYLSNTTASEAREIVDFMRRAGAAGQMIGLSAEKTAAFGAAMVSAGGEVDMAATSFITLAKSLSRGDSMTERQISALQRLGLAAGTAATEMSKAQQDMARAAEDRRYISALERRRDQAIKMAENETDAVVDEAQRRMDKTLEILDQQLGDEEKKLSRKYRDILTIERRRTSDQIEALRNRYTSQDAATRAFVKQQERLIEDESQKRIDAIDDQEDAEAGALKARVNNQKNLYKQELEEVRAGERRKMEAKKEMENQMFEESKVNYENQAKTARMQADEYARQAGVSAGLAVSRALQQNSLATILDIFSRLKALPKELQVATMTDLFGDEIRTMIPVIENMGTLQQALTGVADGTNYLGSVQNEYNKRLQTTAQQLKLAQNQFDALGIQLGDTLLPLIINLLKLFDPVLNAFDYLVKTQPELVLVGMALAGIAAAAILLAPLAASIITLVGSLAALGVTVGMVAGTLGIGALIAAVVVLAVVFRDKLGALPAFVLEIMQAVANPIGAALKLILDLVGKLFSALAPLVEAAVKKLWKWLGDRFNDLGKLISGLADGAGKILGSIGNAVRDAFMAIPNMLRAGINAALSWAASGVNGLIGIINSFIGQANRLASAVRLPGLPFIPTVPIPQFAGGGYTGNAPRTGGIDGKGGFMAVLHPRETVIDHTRGQTGARPGITIQTGPVLQQPDGSRWVSMEDLERGMAMAVDQALGIVASPAGRMALGGA